MQRILEVCLTSADEARAARSALGADGLADDLVEMTTITGSRLHVSRFMLRSPSEGQISCSRDERAQVSTRLFAS